MSGLKKFIEKQNSVNIELRSKNNMLKNENENFANLNDILLEKISKLEKGAAERNARLVVFILSL